MNTENTQTQDKTLVGMLGQFDSPDTLLHACENARNAGIKQMDAYTPFPVHGIEKAMGIPRTILPFIVLAVGMTGCLVGLGLQWYTNGTEWNNMWSGYQFRISGKPFFSLPANIPVTFEIIVLSSAFAAFLGMLILNGLPRFANPLQRIPRFKRVTNDRFFLALGAAEEGFDADTARSNLSNWGATDVEEVWLDQTDHQMPAFLKTFVVLGLIMLMIPPVLIFRARAMTSRQTRLHFNPDMDFQIKYKPQTLGPVATNEGGYFFDHMRSSFAAVPGTVARGQGQDDIEYLRGIRAGSLDEQTSLATPAVLASIHQQEQEPAGDPPAADDTPPEPDWITRFPNQVDISPETLERGKNRFDVYCAVCHGYSGEGNGLVNQRAMALAINGNASWTTAKSLYDAEVMKQPVGRIYDTISNGRSTMGPYGSRITPEDRWAIVLYVKALHETRRNAPKPDPNAVPATDDAETPDAG